MWLCRPKEGEVPKPEWFGADAADTDAVNETLMDEESRSRTRPSTPTRNGSAKRAGSHTVEINSSHVALISHPEAVTDLVLQAATAAER
jgi:hypothetical protein